MLPNRDHHTFPDAVRAHTHAVEEGPEEQPHRGEIMVEQPQLVALLGWPTARALLEVYGADPPVTAERRYRANYSKGKGGV